MKAAVVTESGVQVRDAPEPRPTAQQVLVRVRACGLNRADLAVLVQGDKRLFNQYGVLVVNPARHPHVKKDLAQAFVDWLVSAPGQATIASYRIGGEQLFFPNAQR